MADPTIQTFCCHHRNESDFAVRLMNEFDKDSYVISCMVSSSIGIIGALYQIFFRTEISAGSRTSTTSPTIAIGRHIIVALAVADFCASFGVLVRSVFWKLERDFVPMEDDTVSVLFCATSSAWMQFFYTATWFYTLFYAISVYMILKGKIPPLRTFHVLVWTTSAALTTFGLTVLYVPNADCHDIHKMSTALLRVLPIYLVTYVPIIMVMLINPIVYYYSSRNFDEQLVIGQNQVTQAERTLMKRFKVKFSFINIIFFICWLPNLISGILLWFFWYTLPVKFILATWNCMAVLNPLQAFFNTLVYRKWTRFSLPERIRDFYYGRKPKVESRRLHERSPLLRTSSYQFRSASTIGSVESVDTGPSVNSCSCV